MPDPKQDPSKSAVETGWEEPAHPKPPIARRPLPGLPQEKPSSPHIQTGKDESSLALLGKDLMPPPPAAQAPTQIDVSTLGNANDRKVKFPGVWITVRNWFRRWSGKFKALPKHHKRIILGLLGVAVILIVVLIAVSGEDKPKESRGSKLAKQGQELLNKNTPKHAAELIESELVGASQAGDGEAYMVLGHARFAMKRYLESLTAYERALTQDPKLASDTVLRANAIKVLDTKDSVAAVVALEILASRVQPPAHDEVVRYASSGKMQDARRRAFAIAEREGLSAKIDRVESWSLDLQAAGTCEDRRSLIAKLASTNDKRAIPALKRAKLYKCAEKDATDAINALEGGDGAPAKQ